MAFEARLEGFKELDNKLRKLGGSLAEEIEDALLEGGEIVANEALVTGPLGDRASILTMHAEKDKRFKNAKTFKKVLVQPDPDNWQLIFPEYGTINQKEQKFLRKALEKKRPAIESLVEGKISNLIKKVESET